MQYSSVLSPQHQRLGDQQFSNSSKLLSRSCIQPDTFDGIIQMNQSACPSPQNILQDISNLARGPKSDIKRSNLSSTAIKIKDSTSNQAISPSSSSVINQSKSSRAKSCTPQQPQHQESKQSCKQQEKVQNQKSSFNLRSSIETRKQIEREQAKQILLSNICHMDPLIQQASKLFSIKQKKLMFNEDHRSKQMRQDSLLEDICDLEKKALKLKDQEWSSFEYDVSKYMEFILKEINVIRLNSDIQIKQRQLNNINALLKHLIDQYSTQKATFFNLIEKINLIADDKDIDVMEEYIKTQMLIGGRQLYEVMINVLDYRQMRQRVLIQEVDEFYSVRVCSVSTLLIVEQVQKEVVKMIEGNIRHFIKCKFIKQTMALQAQVYDPSNKSLSTIYEKKSILNKYIDQLKVEDEQLNTLVKQSKSSIQQLLEQVDCYKQEQLACFIKTFTNLQPIISMLIASFKQKVETSEQENLENLILTHMKRKQQQFAKIIEIVRSHEHDILAMESLVYQIRVNLLKTQCFQQQTNELSQSLSKSIEDKLELESQIKQMSQNAFPKKEKTEYLMRSECPEMLDSSSANFLELFNVKKILIDFHQLKLFKNTNGSQNRRELIMNKALGIKNQISLLEVKRQKSQKFLDEEIKGELMTLDILIRKEKEQLLSSIQEVFGCGNSKNDGEIQIVQNILEYDYIYASSILKPSYSHPEITLQVKNNNSNSYNYSPHFNDNSNNSITFSNNTTQQQLTSPFSTTFNTSTSHLSHLSQLSSPPSRLFAAHQILDNSRLFTDISSPNNQSSISLYNEDTLKSSNKSKTQSTHLQIGNYNPNKINLNQSSSPSSISNSSKNEWFNDPKQPASLMNSDSNNINFSGSNNKKSFATKAISVPQTFYKQTKELNQRQQSQLQDNESYNYRRDENEKENVRILDKEDKIKCNQKNNQLDFNHQKKEIMNSKVKSTGLQYSNNTNYRTASNQTNTPITSNNKGKPIKENNGNSLNSSSSSTSHIDQFLKKVDEIKQQKNLLTQKNTNIPKVFGNPETSIFLSDNENTPIGNSNNNFNSSNNAYSNTNNIDCSLFSQQYCQPANNKQQLTSQQQQSNSLNQQPQQQKSCSLLYSNSLQGIDMNDSARTFPSFDEQSQSCSSQQTIQNQHKKNNDKHQVVSYQSQNNYRNNPTHQTTKQQQQQQQQYQTYQKSQSPQSFQQSSNKINKDKLNFQQCQSEYTLDNSNNSSNCNLNNNLSFSALQKQQQQSSLVGSNSSNQSNRNNASFRISDTPQPQLDITFQQNGFETQFGSCQKQQSNKSPQKQQQSKSACPNNNFNRQMTRLIESEMIAIGMNRESEVILNKPVSNSVSVLSEEYQVLFRQINTSNTNGSNIIYTTPEQAIKCGGFCESTLKFDIRNKNVTFITKEFQLTIPVNCIEKLVVPSQIINSLQFSQYNSICTQQQQQQKQQQCLPLIQLAVVERGIFEVLSFSNEAFNSTLQQFQQTFY